MASNSFLNDKKIPAAKITSPKNKLLSAVGFISSSPSSGGSRIFRRGRQLPKWDYFANVLPKLHENERIWTPGARIPATPLDPPMPSKTFDANNANIANFDKNSMDTIFSK